MIIAFSMVNRDSFDNIKKYWLPEKKKGMPGAKVNQNHLNDKLNV